MDVNYDTVLKIFTTYQDEYLIPFYLNPKDTKSYKDLVKAGSVCAYDISSNLVYYGQESLHCSTELMSHILRSSDKMMTYAEYQGAHQARLNKLYPDAPVLATTPPDGPKVSAGVSRLAALGVRIQ